MHRTRPAPSVPTGQPRLLPQPHGPAVVTARGSVRGPRRLARHPRRGHRARHEHALARMKGWKTLRDCRLKGDGVHHAMLGIARLHNLALVG